MSSEEENSHQHVNQVVKLTGRRPDLGTYMTSAGSGDVYEHPTDPYRVIKVASFFRRGREGWEKMYQETVKVINHLIKKPNPSVMRVFSFKILAGPRTEPRVYYALEAEKLYPITAKNDGDNIALMGEDIFHGRLPRCFKFSKMKLDNTRKTGVVKQFVKSFLNFPFVHDDLHGRNIMRDSNGRIKLIDVESFYLRPRQRKSCTEFLSNYNSL